MEPTSKLMLLPAELRNRVYEATLATPVYSRSLDRYLNTTNFRQRIALLQTCQQMRQETRALFYATNTIHVTITEENVLDFPRWLSRIGPDMAALIPRVILELNFSALAIARDDMEAMMATCRTHLPVQARPVKMKKGRYMLSSCAALQFAQALIASGLKIQRVTYLVQPGNQLGLRFRNCLKLAGIGSG